MAVNNEESAQRDVEHVLAISEHKTASISARQQLSSTTQGLTTIANSLNEDSERLGGGGGRDYDSDYESKKETTQPSMKSCKDLRQRRICYNSVGSRQESKFRSEKKKPEW